MKGVATCRSCEATFLQNRHLPPQSPERINLVFYLAPWATLGQVVKLPGPRLRDELRNIDVSFHSAKRYVSIAKLVNLVWSKFDASALNRARLV